MKVDDFLGVGN